MIVGLLLSLTHWDGLNAPVFAGLSNYTTLLRDPTFLNSVSVNVKAAAISLATQLPLALFLAALLVRTGGGVRFFRVVFFIPQMLSLVAVGVLWSMIYNPRYGPLALLTQALHLPAISWFGSPNNALLSLMLVTTWVYFGFHMVLQMAGMLAIPAELYDSAHLDTDNPLQVFYYVTLPLLRETLLISTILIISGSFSQLVGLFWVMTRGGPNRGTELIAIYMYKQAFTSHEIGYASTIAMVMFAFMAVIIGSIVLRAGRTRIEY
jgi:raffinose/stachyose/melibiose transport system permease protein